MSDSITELQKINKKFGCKVKPDKIKQELGESSKNKKTEVLINEK